MVTTAEVLSSPALAPFVRCYSLRSFDTGSLSITKPWYAAHEVYLPFFFGTLPVQLFNPLTGKSMHGYYGGMVGLATGYNGEMTFRGDYTFFSIHFTPNGFSKIFRLPSQEFTDLIVGADDFLDRNVKILYEQLEAVQEGNAENKLEDMARLADAYLLGYLCKQGSVDHKDRILHISGMMLTRAGRLPVRQLAYIANMSVRNFERCFQEQIGTSPKLFGRIIRFNNALTEKLKEPAKDWTAIAQEHGYFDQMHLIKDCKAFTGSSPSVFVRETTLLEKDFSQRVDG